MQLQRGQFHRARGIIGNDDVGARLTILDDKLFAENAIDKREDADGQNRKNFHITININFLTDSQLSYFILSVHNLLKYSQFRIFSMRVFAV